MLPIPPDNIIVMIQKSVFEFVWNLKKRDRISWKRAIKNTVKGGLGVPDIKTYFNYYCVEINVDKTI